MEEFKESVRRGFKQCRSDIDFLKLENEILKEKLNSLTNTNQRLNTTITDLTSELKGIKIALDYIKGFQESINHNTQQIAQPQQPIQNLYSQSHIPQPQTNQQDPYEALLAFKAKSNKREILKQKLVSMINENGMNLSELKFMFVDHHRYTSKATFYNYLKELEAHGTIRQERVNSKTHVFLSSAISEEINQR